MIPDKVLNEILHRGSSVHATAEVNGEKRFAKLMLKNGDVHLPAIAYCSSPPASNYTVTVSSLLTRYTSTDIFLTLASGGKELGTVYVKLKDNDSAKYIRKLCMGTIGPCYRGAVFDYKESHCLDASNVSKYDTNSCTELPPPESENITAEKGMVYIFGDTGLGFILSDWSIDSDWDTGKGCGVDGHVINGMSVLEEAHKCHMGTVSISDVGIVLK